MNSWRVQSLTGKPPGCTRARSSPWYRAAVLLAFPCLVALAQAPVNSALPATGPGNTAQSGPSAAPVFRSTIPVLPASERLERLDFLHGARYPGKKNWREMTIAGGVTLGLGLLLGASLVIRGIVLTAPQYMGGDRSPDVSIAFSIGLGASLGVASLAVGIPLIAVGKHRQSAYRAWLLQQPLAGRAHLALAGGGLLLRF